MTIKVVFRKFKSGGDIIALFPRSPADVNGYFCASYQHIGQHGAADPAIVSNTTLATPKEYDPLLKELKSIGYKGLDIGKKITTEDSDYRMKLARKQWRT